MNADCHIIPITLVFIPTPLFLQRRWRLPSRHWSSPRLLSMQRRQTRFENPIFILSSILIFYWLRLSLSFCLQTLTVRDEITRACQIRVLKQNIEATKGEEYYADGLKLIYSGTHWFSAFLRFSCQFAGKILNDAQTVGEYGIKETDFLVGMPGKVLLL